MRRTLLGFALLGFTSIYREGFETVLFLQNLRITFGSSVVLEGWIGTTPIGITLPGWAGEWFSLFPNVETIVAQFGAVLIVVGSYLAAQYLRVWRPRRLHERAAKFAEQPPERPAGTTARPAGLLSS